VREADALDEIVERRLVAKAKTDADVENSIGIRVASAGRVRQARRDVVVSKAGGRRTGRLRGETR